MGCCACLMSGCQTKPAESASLPAPVDLPMEVTYKGKIVSGDMNNVKTVMEFNKRISEMNTDVGDLFSDTVSFNMEDGTQFLNVSRDSALSIIKGFVSNMSEIKVSFINAIPLDNVDQNHQWVLSWTDENYTAKDGKKDHVYLMETIRLKDGKVREVFQFARKEPPAAE